MPFKFILNAAGTIILLVLVSYFVGPGIVSLVIEKMTNGLQEMGALVARLSTDGTAAAMVQKLAELFSRF